MFAEVPHLIYQSRSYFESLARAFVTLLLANFLTLPRYILGSGDDS